MRLLISGQPDRPLAPSSQAGRGPATRTPNTTASMPGKLLRLYRKFPIENGTLVSRAQPEGAQHSQPVRQDHGNTEERAPTVGSPLPGNGVRYPCPACDKQNHETFESPEDLFARCEGFHIGRGRVLPRRGRLGRVFRWAALQGHEAVVRLLLLDEELDLDSRDDELKTPLCLAAGGGHDAVVKLLVKQGADLESRARWGRTLLIWAVAEGRETVVRLLVEKCACRESRDDGGWTAAHWAWFMKRRFYPSPCS